MDFLSITITIAITSVIILLLSFFALLLIIFTGKSIKNPEYPPVKGTVFDQLFYFTRLYDYQTNVARKTPTYRLLTLTQSELYTTDPRNIEHVLKTKFDSYSKGRYNQEVVRDLFGNGIFAVDGSMWRQQRKLASFEFSTRVLRDFSCAVFRRNGAKLAGVVSELAITKTSFDIQDLLMKCTLDSIFKVGFGVELNCLEGSNRDGSAFIKAFDDANELTYWRYPDLFWTVKRFLNIGSEATLRNNIKVVDDFVYGLIRRRRELISTQPTDSVSSLTCQLGVCAVSALSNDTKDIEPNPVPNMNMNEKEDILSRFLMASKEDPTNMNDKYLRDIILNFMIAGKDSTANTLSWFFYMLCKHPLIQEKVVHEIDQVIQCNNFEISIDEFTMNLTDTRLDKMHYLHAAITETLRLYPAVPVDGRCAEVDDVLPDGYRINKGDGLYYIAYAMGRMTYIWGDDGEEFRPERWLVDGVFQPESPFKFISFHAGPRICLGKDFAYRQMKIVAMVLLHFFRFKLADEKRRVTYRTMLTLHIDGGLVLSALARHSSSSFNM